MSENAKSVSTNSRSVLIALFFLVALILLVYTISVHLYTAGQVGRLNSVFIAAITGTLALGGTLITQLWGGNPSAVSNKPVIYQTTPIDSAVEVRLDSRIIVSFNTLIDQTTINTKTFTLKDDKNVQIEGTTTVEGGNAIFKPKDSLKPKTKYTATIAKDIKDMSGRLFGTEKVWSFTTLDQ